MKHSVLLTGPGGRIGPHILPTFHEQFELKILDRSPIESEPETIVADLSSIETLAAAMQGCDTVVHLAATSDEAPFVEELVPNNVVGLYNVFEAARAAGVKRVVFASTVQAVSFYPHEHTVEATDLPRSVSLYGVTKAMGETMGRYYHDKHGLEFIAVRIGWFLDYEHEWLTSGRASAIWLSPRDAASFLAHCVTAENIGYAIVHATSKTSFERLSLAPAREILGWEPSDDVATVVREPSPAPAR
ncbi:NAD(P)-dependent oxidoreductase [Armatimonas sp.]|uniref:NAD-dependent epimerase/dehydratase family protein n=1 Tax=Armatimonas sp. TaxID=1872638 RepID=UPI00286A96B6|nr:NAD(P)-dependent oxidoreductase [Armatimonas sp.]